MVRKAALVLVLVSSSAVAQDAGSKAGEGGPWERYQPRQPNSFDQFDAKPEVLGNGPHTLVISDRNAMTRMEYKTGPQCAKARDAIVKQVTPQPRPGIIPGPPSVKAFCVPR